MAQPNRCSICSELGHCFIICQDPIIIETWELALSNGLFIDNSHVVDMLHDINDNEIVAAVGFQWGNSEVDSSTETHIENICKAIDTIRSIVDSNVFLPTLDSVNSPDIGYNRYINFTDNENDTQNDTEKYNENDNGCNVQAVMLSFETLEELSEVVECGICYEDKSVIDLDTLQCEHDVCHTCIIKLFRSKPTIPCCPFCRAHIKTIYVKDPENYRDIEDLPIYYV
jgi:hypothetical protein